MINKKIFLVIIILLALSLPAIYGLLHPGFFVSDDGEWMVIRFSAFYQALTDGQFPVRFLHRLNFGYGYPVATFLYPGFMYFATPIHLIGFGFVNTIKIVFGLALVFSSIFSFFWLRHIFKPIPSVLGALFYLYTPYHLYDVYKRGSVGEVFALMLVPFVLWNIERKSFFWSALGIGWLILAHNSLALFLLPVVFMYACIRKRFCLSNLFSVFFLGLFTASFFILPAVVELRYTKFSNIQISSPFEYFANFNLVGLSTILIFLTSGFLLFWKKEKDKVMKLFIVIGIICLILATETSTFFWIVVPSSFVQFPFRLLSVVLVCVAYLSAFCLEKVNKGHSILVLIIFVATLVFSSFPYLLPKEYNYKSEEMYATNEDTTTVRSEYMPVWVKTNPSEHFREKVELINGNARVSNVGYDSKSISFVVNAISKTDLKINTVYWPGWKLDGEDVKITENGMIMVSNVVGDKTINLNFQETKLRLFSDLLSLISLIAVCYISLFKYRSTNL